MSYYLADESQQNGAVRKYVKVGAALIGGACLVLLTMVGISVIAPGLQNTSTNLIGIPTMNSLRANPMMNRITPSTLAALPGPSPWKELGIAALEDANRCSLDRDVSTNAHSKMKEVFQQMNPQDRELVVQFGRKVQKKAAQIKQTKTTEELLKPAPFGLETGMVGPVKGLWDPFGLSTNINEAQLLFFREAELKHGRVCMLATLGFIVQEKFHPLFGGDIDVPAIQSFAQAPLALFWPAFIAAAGALEFGSFERFDYETEGFGFGVELLPGEEPGNIGWDPLNLRPADPEELEKRKNQEILHGRLAMISAAGLIAQELLTQAKIGEGGIFEANS